MPFQRAPARGQLVRRYKRFFADCLLEGGAAITAHTANTGAMTGLLAAGNPVLLTNHEGTARKLPIIAGLLLSAAATEWLGLHYIFGAFLFGVVLPRSGTDRLRHEVHDRVGHMSSTLLLPVFFLIAGLQVDLSGVDVGGLGALGLILLVAVGGKFLGAFAAARLNRMPVRQAAALATLMNTRGLTELIVLNVGLQLGFLGQELYSLMVVMAVVTTAMAGPLLTWLLGRPTGNDLTDTFADTEAAEAGDGSPRAKGSTT